MRRRYRGDTLILETELETTSGVVRLIDFMPPRGENPDIVRIIEGVRGKVSDANGTDHPFRLRAHRSVGAEGAVADWKRLPDPTALILRTPIETHGEDLTTVAEFTVEKGDRVPFVLTWFASHRDRRARSIRNTRCAIRKSSGATGRSKL